MIRGTLMRELSRYPRLSTLVFVGFAMTFTPAVRAQDLGPEWRSLAAKDALITFAVPGLKGKIVRHMRTTDPRYRFTMEFAVWSGATTHHPTAIVYHTETLPGYHFCRETDPKDFVRRLDFFKGKSIEFGSRERSTNSQGQVRYRRFRFETIQCAAFVQYFGVAEDAGVGTNEVGGYYCAEPDDHLSDERVVEILKSVRIKRR